MDLQKKKHDSQNKPSNAMEGEGNLLARRKHAENELEILKSHILPKSKKKESSMKWILMKLFHSICHFPNN